MKLVTKLLCTKNILSTALIASRFLQLSRICVEVTHLYPNTYEVAVKLAATFSNHTQNTYFSVAIGEFLLQKDPQKLGEILLNKH